MKTIRTIIISVIVFLLGFVIVKAIKKSNEKIDTISIKRVNIDKTLTISGYIEPDRVIDVRSNISGTLQKLMVNLGDKVDLGKSLASVKFVKDPIELRQLKDNIEVSKRRLDAMTIQYERMQKLFNDGFVSKEEFEQEQTDFEVMKKNHETLVAELDMVEDQQSKNKVSNIISATNSGTIIELPVKEGGSVMARGTYSEGSIIARIADFSSMNFVGTVAENDIDKVKIGTNIEITTATNRDITISGIVTEIAPVSSRSSGVVTFEIKAAINKDDLNSHKIYSGSSAMGKITIAKRDSVWGINEKYVNYRGDSTYFNIVNKKGHIEKTFVKLGISDGINVEIISGVDSTTLIKSEEK
ncbi:MAG: efflux RND transporter periplasmic adaptor subunit [Bacteroidales bacterium]|nr:efflux RND transporter periplasmic adaptor subunit [Bacteroidales bacterium]